MDGLIKQIKEKPLNEIIKELDENKFPTNDPLLIDLLNDRGLYQRLGYPKSEFIYPSTEIVKRMAYLAMKLGKKEIELIDLYK